MCARLKGSLINHYAALEVEEWADGATIKRAYRGLVLRWHPDKHPVGEGRDAAEERIRLINLAYETLGNPTRRETYDLQRRALERHRSGLGPEPASAAASPRVSIPKEFMVQPMGHPDKFLRCTEDEVFVHARRDARADFQAFFRATKFALWWVPEVNNMCRIRALGSRARGDKKAAAAGLAGGLNLAFSINGDGVIESEVKLKEARKGQKNDTVNFIAKGSAAYQGAFRFEAACRKGCYLAYLPPADIGVISLLEKERVGVIDFVLVDFAAMTKFIDLEEVLLPAVTAIQATWVPVSKVREDANVKLYFQDVLQKPLWDIEDFASYFEGHWTQWEYRVEEQCVRARTPSERLGRLLGVARHADDIVYAVQEAGDELQRIPLQVAVHAIQLLANSAPLTATEGGLATVATYDRDSALGKVVGALSGVLSSASEGTSSKLSCMEALRIMEQILAFGGKAPRNEVCTQRTVAGQVLGEYAARSIAQAALPIQLDQENLFRLLRAPGIAVHDEALAPALSATLFNVDLSTLVDALDIATAAHCHGVTDAVAAAALRALDRAEGADEVAGVLRKLAEVGVRLVDVGAQLGVHASSLGTSALGVAVAALGSHGISSPGLVAAAKCLAARADFSSLGFQVLLALGVAASKNAALEPIVGAVARSAALSIGVWSTGDLVRLFLALAKTKALLPPADRDALLSKSAAVVGLQIASLGATDLVKLVLAICGWGSSALLEAAAVEVVRRLSDLPQVQLLLLTQALAQGLGGAHSVLHQVLDFWAELVTEQPAAAAAAPPRAATGTSAGAAAGRGAGAEALSADQLAKLAQVAAPSLGGWDGAEHFFEAVGSRLLARAEEVSPGGRETLKAQLASKDGLGGFSGRARLLRALSSASAGGEEGGERGGAPAGKRPRRCRP